MDEPIERMEVVSEFNDKQVITNGFVFCSISCFALHYSAHPECYAETEIVTKEYDGSKRCDNCDAFSGEV